jgi:hypothetical protein
MQRIILSSHDHLDNNFNYFGALDSLKYKPNKIRKLIYKNRLENSLNSNNDIFLISFEKIKMEIETMEIKKEQSIELLCSLKNELCDKKFVLYDVIDQNTNLWNKVSIFALK